MNIRNYDFDPNWCYGTSGKAELFSAQKNFEKQNLCVNEYLHKYLVRYSQKIFVLDLK